MNYLSKKSLIIGFILSNLEKFSNIEDCQLSDTYENFKIEKNFYKYSENRNCYRVILLLDKKGNRYIARDLCFKFKNMKYKQIMNEISLLKTLHSAADKINEGSSISFPQVIKIIEERNRLVFIRNYFAGDNIRSYSPNEKIKFIELILKDLKKYSDNLTYDRDNIPIRTAAYINIIFPIVSFIFFLKEPRMIFRIINFIIQFYRYRLYLNRYKFNYIFANRDLHQDNIIIRDKKIMLIDSEISLFAEPETDLAIALKYYYKDFKNKLSENFLKKVLKDDISRRRFLSLTIFYTFMTLIIEKKNTTNYRESINYLDFIEKRLVKKRGLEI